MSPQQILFACGTLASSISISHGATTWNAGMDLSTNEISGPNDLLIPNSAVPEWSYGYRETVLGTTFSPYATPTDHTNALGGNPQFQGWQSGLLTTVVNTGVSVPGLNAFDILVHPQAANHPTATFNVIRWVAPISGSFDIAAQWLTPDLLSDGVDVNILVNGISIFSTAVVPNVATTNAQTVALNSGDILDFVVGPGATGNAFNDSTAFNATIVVPEPSSALLAVAALPLLLRRRRVGNPEA